MSILEFSVFLMLGLTLEMSLKELYAMAKAGKAISGQGGRHCLASWKHLYGYPGTRITANVITRPHCATGFINGRLPEVPKITCYEVPNNARTIAAKLRTIRNVDPSELLQNAYDSVKYAAANLGSPHDVKFPKDLEKRPGNAAEKSLHGRGA